MQFGSLVLFDENKETDGIADFLACLSGLVMKNSYLFENLAEKTEFSSAKYHLSKTFLTAYPDNKTIVFHRNNLN